jgi:hypothetical protein
MSFKHRWVVLPFALTLFAGLGSGVEGFGGEGATSTVLPARQVIQETQQSQEAQPRQAYPWRVGEKLTYDAKINFLRVGTGVMTVEGLDTVRGRTVFHTTFTVRGRMLFFTVRDKYESWFDTTSLASMRYRQDIDEGSYEAKREFEFFPERATFSENGKEEVAGVAEPLDEGSFIYFVRSIPLQVGETYEFNRYFRPDRNPVQLKVLRKERINVPAGGFDAIVVQPIIKTKGLFSDKGKAEIWIADDSTRVMLAMKSGLPFGTLHLELKKIEYLERP